LHKLLIDLETPVARYNFHNWYLRADSLQALRIARVNAVSAQAVFSIGYTINPNTDPS
jgi:F420-dependent methylenetetrahydromethanopterin dehydrogenase